MKIEKSLCQPDGVRAVMQHTCGHATAYWFAAEEFAKHSQESYESQPCLSCRNESAVAAFQRRRAPKN